MEALQYIGLRPAFFVPIIITVSLLVVAGLLFWIWSRTIKEHEGLLIAGLMVGVIGAIALVISLIMCIPYQTKYYGVYRVSGNITNVTNSFENGDGELSTRPVIELDTLDSQVTTSNPRVLGLEGKDVTLTCVRNWKYASADYIECDLYSVNR